MTHIAMDVHQATSTLAYVVPGGERPQVRRVTTSAEQIGAVLAELPQPWVVAVEASRQSPAVCKWLQALGAEVHLADPQQLHQLGKLQAAKTDGKDALVMLKALVHGFLPECYLAEPEVEAQRALSRGRMMLRRMATMLRNQLRALLAQQGLSCAARDLRGQRARGQLVELLGRLPQLVAFIAGVCWDLLEQVELALATAEAEMRRQVQAHPVGRLLLQLPGVGVVTAFGLLAEIGDVARFDTPKQLHSYAGLTPRVRQSDSFDGQRYLPQRCSKRLRYWSVLAAQGAVRSDGTSRMAQAYQRLRTRHGPNTAKVAAARVLLTEVFYRWRHAAALPRDAVA